MNKLRELRLSAALTQKQLADKAGINLSNISRLENGGQKAQPLTLARLAQALAVPLQTLSELALEQPHQLNQLAALSSGLDNIELANSPASSPSPSSPASSLFLLRDLRLSAGLTQKQLADRAGVDLSRLNRLENGHQHASATTIARLAQALAVPLQTLDSLAVPNKRGTDTGQADSGKQAN